MEGYYAELDDGGCKVRALIHPRVKPRIAFVTRAELRGPAAALARAGGRQHLAAARFVVIAIYLLATVGT